jgi:alkanesulfonate monooxygenase SsuD/methylene tetrahydromethanopterin reductase-like flavin-dependent oxidoreductase (luciferase family)
MPATRVGVWLFPAKVDRSGDQPIIEGPQSVVDAVKLAEQHGFDEVWIGDEGPSGWDPFIVAGLALASTSRIRIGIGIANPVTRHAGTSALIAATLNAQFPGRIALGLGCGGSLPLVPFGLLPAKVADVRSAVMTMRATLNGVANEFYAPPDLHISAPGVGIYLGGRGPKINTLASELADGVFLSGIAIDQLDAVIGWAQSVRPIDLVIMPVVDVSDEQQTLRTLMGRYPGQCVGISLVGDDPKDAVERVGQALAAITGSTTEP